MKTADALVSVPRAAVVTALLGSAALMPASSAASFDDEVAFLKQHTRLIVLGHPRGQGRIAVAPAWQGRVMTSTDGGAAGLSYGWINRNLIASGRLQPHINVFGGEDRFWLGPEGGQFSIFFAPGAKFDLAGWQTPFPLDTMPYEVAKQTASSATFRARFMLTNYSGARFDVKVDRQVRVLPAATAWQGLGVKPARGVNLVAYESVNRIANAGQEPWRKETGLLSIWMLGMFNHGPQTTVVVPIEPGPESRLGTRVTSDYFGPIPADRLAVQDKAIFFCADGQFRSKIGIGPRRSKGVLGSYDALRQVLTIVRFTQPEGVTDYVNSLWKIQDHPFGGDAANSYNDGLASPGATPLGPFYEMESSSPAAALAPGRSLTHVHRTIHLSGPETALDQVARAVLGVSLADIQSALRRPRTANP